MKWIVGLGNPGKRYAGTRHNLGFQVLDRFAALHSSSFRERFSALLAELSVESVADKVLLMKPQTYMNRSGDSVRAALDYYGSPPGDLLVVHDDLDLPLGRLRYRSHSRSGGHRGVESIIQALGTDEFSRLKIGIGRREDEEAAEFVLDPPAADEKKVLERAAERAVESLKVYLTHGLDRAALLYNGQEPGEQHGEPRPAAGDRRLATGERKGREGRGKGDGHRPEGDLPEGGPRAADPGRGDPGRGGPGRGDPGRKSDRA